MKDIKEEGYFRERCIVRPARARVYSRTKAPCASRNYTHSTARVLFWGSEGGHTHNYILPRRRCAEVLLRSVAPHEVRQPRAGPLTGNFNWSLSDSLSLSLLTIATSLIWTFIFFILIFFSTSLFTCAQKNKNKNTHTSWNSLLEFKITRDFLYIANIFCFLTSVKLPHGNKTQQRKQNNNNLLSNQSERVRKEGWITHSYILYSRREPSPYFGA